MVKKVMSTQIEMEKYVGDESLTVEQAKELLGWREVEPPKGVDSDAKKEWKDAQLADGAKFFLKGKAIFLDNSTHNRPFRMSFAKEYANEILRHKWVLNGETIIINAEGQLHSGQHRLVGLIFAEMDREAKPKFWAERHGWDGPCSIETLVVRGVESSTADTVDKAQKRTHGDVIFRRKELGEGWSEREQQMIANDLAVAARLLWLRLGGKKVSDAGKFVHSEMLDLLEQHPYLKDMVEKVFEIDGGDTRSDPKIRHLVSRGYLACMAYLYGVSDTDPEAFTAKGEADYSKWEDAVSFVEEFAEGSAARGKPSRELRELFVRQTSKGGSRNRDYDVVGPIVKAILANMNGEELTAKSINLGDKRKNVDLPILPGIDGGVLEEFIPEIEEEPKPRTPRGKKATVETNGEEAPKGKGGRKKKPKVVERKGLWYVEGLGNEEFGPYDDKEAAEKEMNDVIEALKEEEANAAA